MGRAKSSARIWNLIVGRVRYRRRLACDLRGNHIRPCVFKEESKTYQELPKDSVCDRTVFAMVNECHSVTNLGVDRYSSFVARQCNLDSCSSPQEGEIV